MTKREPFPVRSGNIGTTFTVETGYHPCPFCDGQYSAGSSASGTPGVLHTDPACKNFLAREPLDYLRQCRIARGL